MRPAIFLIALLLVVKSTHIYSQPVYIWAKSLGGGSGSGDIGYAVTTDTNRNVISTGEFWGTADFDPGPANFDLTAVGNHDVFISKLDSAGNFVWAKRIGGTSADYGYSIKSDAQGNIYVAGVFSYTVDFDPGPSTYNLTAPGSNWDVFVLKLNTLGDFVWAKRIGGTSNDIAYSISLDTIGNIYVSGWFALTADFDPGASTFNITSTGLEDAFICKLDNTGSFIWAKKLGGTGSDRSVAVVSGQKNKIYVGGTFEGACDFDPGATTFLMNSKGATDVYVSAFDTSGNFLWVSAIGGTYTDMSSGVDIDNGGNVYASGYFYDTAHFYSSSNFIDLVSGGNEDIFVSRLDTNGNFTWAKTIGGINSETNRIMKVDNNAVIHLSGNFLGTTDFDPGPNVFDLSPATNGYIYLCSIDSFGNFVCAGSFGGNYPNSVCVDKAGDIYITGNYNGTNDFDPGTGIANLTSVGGSSDIFITKYVACEPCYTTHSVLNLSACDHLNSPSGNYIWSSSGVYTDTIQNIGGCDSVVIVNLTVINSTYSSINPVACRNYTFPSGTQTVSASGIYNDTLTNIAGCDSVITINLSVIAIDTSVSASDSGLIANENSAGFQWLDCNNSYLSITNETNAIFLPDHSGNFAVQITFNGCIDTSSCHDFVFNPMSVRLITHHKIKISPNPTSDKIIIEGPDGIESISIYNSIGEVLYTKQNSFHAASTTIDLTSFTEGIYFIKLQGSTNTFTQKIIFNKEP